MADHDQRLALEARQPPDDGRIVTEEPVAVQLGEVLEEQLAPVARVGTLGMPRQLRALPRGEGGVSALALALEPVLQARDLVRVRRVVGGLQRRDAELQLEERLLEIQSVRHSRSSAPPCPAAPRPRSPARGRRPPRSRASGSRPTMPDGLDFEQPLLELEL